MHIYLDESGDTGFKFGEGSSGYFVVALVLVPDVTVAEEAVRGLRAALNEPEGYEFKFTRMPRHLCVAVLRGLVGIGVSAHVLVVNKRRLVAPELRDRDAFYMNLMQAALEINMGNIRAARLVIDQSFKGKAKKADLATHLKRGINAEAAGNVKRIAKVMYRESHRDQLLQVADVVAGAVAHAYEREDPAFMTLIEGLLTVREHP